MTLAGQGSPHTIHVHGFEVRHVIRRLDAQGLDARYQVAIRKAKLLGQFVNTHPRSGDGRISAARVRF
jgi:hypothetical protein